MHHPKYLEEKIINHQLNEDLSDLQVIDGVKGVSQRMLASGMISSPKGARGILVRGIQPAAEDSVTRLSDLLIEGKYFGTKARNPIIIGQEMAEKLKVKLRQKVVITFQSKEGDIVAGAFRIIGIYKAKNSQYETMNVFVRQKDLAETNGENMIHEVAIVVNHIKAIDQVQALIASKYPGTIVRNYQEISPDISLYESQIQVNLLVIIAIIMLALIFGIINTMLMAVLERIKELGMLMAVGMNKFKVFMMIVFETIILGVIGAPLGMLLGKMPISYFGSRGIDLSSYSKGMRQFGMSEILYPHLEGNVFIQLAVAVLITALLASIYPAYKAIKLRPVEAIRSI
jgi:ABC-type lipoprotein release transport system permease subunit